MWGWVLGPWAEWIELSWTDSGLRVPESSLPTNRWGCDPTQLLLGVQYPITGVSRLVGEASSVQFNSVTQLCPTLCDPWTAAWEASLFMTNSWTLLKLMYIEWVMPSNHLILCRPLPTFNLSRHQGLFQRVISLHQVAKVLGFQLQHQSFQWIFRKDLL